MPSVVELLQEMNKPEAARPGKRRELVEEKKENPEAIPNRLLPKNAVGLRQKQLSNAGSVKHFQLANPFATQKNSPLRLSEESLVLQHQRTDKQLPQQPLLVKQTSAGTSSRGLVNAEAASVFLYLSEKSGSIVEPSSDERIDELGAPTRCVYGERGLLQVLKHLCAYVSTSTRRRLCYFAELRADFAQLDEQAGRPSAIGRVNELDQEEEEAKDRNRSRKRSLKKHFDELFRGVEERCESRPFVMSYGERHGMRTINTVSLCSSYRESYERLLQKANEPHDIKPVAKTRVFFPVLGPGDNGIP